MSEDQFIKLYTDNPQLISVFHRPGEEDTNLGIAVSLNINRHSSGGKASK